MTSILLKEKDTEGNRFRISMSVDESGEYKVTVHARTAPSGAWAFIRDAYYVALDDAIGRFDYWLEAAQAFSEPRAA